MQTTALNEFKNFSAVPRRSYHNEKAIAYCIDWAKSHGLEFIYDDVKDNVVIKRPASPGKEDRPGIVLQGHLDMVPQTDKGIDHDWENEGLDLIEDGDIITANGTTLGADNGAAIAIALALLADDDFANPPLEAFFTTNEEVGMDSVKNADLSYIKGKYLFNLDGGEEGQFVTGCCGGLLLLACVAKEREVFDGQAYTITVTGLKGGHSGIEIGTERANALKLTGDVLAELSRKYDFRIRDIVAEGKDNAISKEASVDIVVAEDATPADIAQVVKEVQKKANIIYRVSDPDIKFEMASEASCRKEVDKNCLSQKATDALITLLRHLPQGALAREQSRPEIVETSCNIGLVKNTDEDIKIVVSLRSSVSERIDELKDKVEELCSLAGAKMEVEGKEYPAWLPDDNNPLIKIFSDKYKEMYGKEANAGPIHAGLECGYILQNSGIEAAIATGPAISGEHTTKESMSISSLQRTYEFIKAVAESI